MTAIRKHLRDFLAIIFLLVVALVVAVVILSHQRVALPPGVPLLGKDFVEVEAELSTAQAVTPGQGQTVNIAGVEVGQISSVKLENGKATVGHMVLPQTRHNAWELANERYPGADIAVKYGHVDGRVWFPMCSSNSASRKPPATW